MSRWKNDDEMPHHLTMGVIVKKTIDAMRWGVDSPLSRVQLVRDARWLNKPPRSEDKPEHE